MHNIELVWVIDKTFPYWEVSLRAFWTHMSSFRITCNIDSHTDIERSMRGAA